MTVPFCGGRVAVVGGLRWQVVLGLLKSADLDLGDDPELSRWAH